MIGWFSSFFFCFVFFLPSPNTVPWEQQWLTCKVFVSEWKMQTSTTETRAHCQQRLAALLQQWQANTLAQLGSNPLKPLLSATADPTTPSGGSEKWVYFWKKNLYILFCCPQIWRTGSRGWRFPSTPRTTGAISFCLALHSILKSWLRFQSA